GLGLIRPITEGRVLLIARSVGHAPLGRGQGQCLSLKFVILTWERARSNLAHGRAPSRDTLNHSVSVDRRGLRGVRLPLFLCGGSDRLDDCGGGHNELCWTILAMG